MMIVFFKKIIVYILTLEARLVLLKYRPHVIAISGSVGKTSTKEAVYTALSSSLFVRKSQKSFNGELGIPLTILGCNNAWNNPFLWLRNILKGMAVILFPTDYPSWLVLEVGLDRPGDIERVVRWLKTDVVVYTRLSDNPVHVEFFDSVKTLNEEKRLLINSLKIGGVLITNSDDSLQKDFAKEGTIRMSYGVENESSVQGSHINNIRNNSSPSGITFRVNYSGSSVPVQLLGVLGKQHVYPVLAGCAVGVSQEKNLIDIVDGFKKSNFLPGRMNILKGINESVIIDDSYNSSPVAAHAALDVLDDMEVEGEKVCVLGDMTELGKLSDDAHKEVGDHIARVCDLLVAVGQRMETAAIATRIAGMNSDSVVNFHTANEAGDYIKSKLKKNDVVLVKGSQALRMERVVKRILSSDESAKDVLVRQDKHWLEK